MSMLEIYILVTITLAIIDDVPKSLVWGPRICSSILVVVQELGRRLLLSHSVLQHIE